MCVCVCVCECVCGVCVCVPVPELYCNLHEKMIQYDETTFIYLFIGLNSTF